MSATTTITTNDIKIIVDRYTKDIEWIHEMIHEVKTTILIGKHIKSCLMQGDIPAKNIEELLCCDFTYTDEVCLECVFGSVKKMADYTMDLFKDYEQSLGKWIDQLDDFYEPTTGVIKMKAFKTVSELMEDVLSFLMHEAKSYEWKKDFWLKRWVTGFDMTRFRYIVSESDCNTCEDCGCEKQVKESQELWEELLPTSMHEKFFSSSVIE